MKFYKTILVIILLFTTTYSQNDQSIVAKVGNQTISDREFKLRLELTPYIPEDKNINPDSIKYDFLYSWIAEKLWADAAEQSGYGNTERFNFYFKPLENMFIRDALFKKEIFDKIQLIPADVNNGIMKSQAKLSTQMIISNDSTVIFRFYKKINLTNNFDSILTLNSNLVSKDLEVTFGSLADEEIEDSLYSLKVNLFTAPIKSEIGWVLFRIKNKTLIPFDITDNKNINQIEEITKNRRIRNRYNEYLKKLLTGITITINPESFNFVAKEIWEKLKKYSSADKKIKYYELTESDFESLLNSFPAAKLNESLFNIDKHSINNGSFISQLAFNGFSVDQFDSVVVLQKLNKKLKQFVDDQLITREAYKQQVNLTEAVRNDLSNWREKYLSQFFFNEIMDSVIISDNELSDFYQSELQDKSNLTLINVRVLNLYDLDAIAAVLDQIKAGKNFGEIMKLFGRTDSLVNNFGETGLQPIISLGYIGNIAADLKLNEVYGPIQRNNSYSLFQVIERREPDDSVQIPFESIKNQLRATLKIKKFTYRMNSITASLAVKEGVKIYNDSIDKIEISEIPMFVHRLMGFGGRISGMPLVTPFSGWIKNVNKQKLLP